MAIAFVDGATGDQGTGGAIQTIHVTIPGDVATGNVCWVYNTNVATGTTPSISSTGTTPTLITTASAFAGQNYTLWWFIAGASDAGATISITSSSSAFQGAIFLAYSGAATSQPDVSASGDTGNTTQSTWTSPTAVTNTGGDWRIDFGTVTGAPSSLTGPGTARETAVHFTISATDSNGSVGSSGTTIGGGTWSANAAGKWSGFTVGMAPVSSGANISLVASAVALAAPAVGPAIGPNPFPAPGVALAAPVPSLTFGAASIPLPVAQLVLAAPLAAPPAFGGDDVAPWHIRRRRR